MQQGLALQESVLCAVDISGKQGARMFWSWHSPPGHISDDRCNIRMYTVELQVQTKRYGIVFSVFSKAESLRIFLNKMQRSFFLWKKITTCHFLEKRWHFSMKREHFAQRLAQAVSGIAWQWVYIRPEQDTVPLAEMTFPPHSELQILKNTKLLFP